MSDYALGYLMLFTDGSVDNQSGIGYGAHLVVVKENSLLSAQYQNVKVKKFSETSSARLELQTLLWALNNIQPGVDQVMIYTDSQNIVSLMRRRQSLEKNDYRTGDNKQLQNKQLYQEFYSLNDRLSCKFVKVRGHVKSNQRDNVDRLFALVDRASRRALRKSR